MKARRSKYNNKKTTYFGRTFDSIKEANRYLYLKSELEKGNIQKLELQPSFVIVPAFNKDGIKYREVKYRADFLYLKGGQIIVEDVKGKKTAIYEIKKKLFEYVYPELTIKEIL